MPQSDDRFEEGRRHFNAGRFFEAHEAWEAVWMEAEGADKQRLQGLIQAAVALHHLGRGNLKGARYLLGKCRARFAGSRAIKGINLHLLLKGLTASVENGAPPPRI